MASSVHVELLVGFLFKHAGERTFAELQIDQPLREHFVRDLVIIAERGTRFYRLNAGQLRCQYELVNIALWATEFSSDRKGARNVGRITFQLAPGVDQHQIAFFQLGGIFAVVQYAGVATRGDNTAIGRLSRAIFHEFVQQLRFDLVLEHARLREAHGAHMRVRRDLVGTRHDLNFSFVLDEPHLAHHCAQIANFSRCCCTCTYFCTHRVQPAADQLVPHGGRADRRMNHMLICHQVGNARFKFGDGIRLIEREHFLANMRAKAESIPNFPLDILVAAKQYVARLFAQHDC